MSAKPSPPLDFGANWQVPKFSLPFWSAKQHPWCVIIPVINEGKRIRSQLSKMNAMNISEVADIIIVDGGSQDGSVDVGFLQQQRVHGLLLKTGPGKLSAQLRCGYAFALEQGYQGIITIDGNDKDDPAAIPSFVDALQSGVDFAQASRFIPGGKAENTPKLREFAIRYLHAPILSFCSGFR
ncbi:MAG: glycosyltransferase family 2 protein, partial [Pseudomonadota bacterium]